jgi:hypothetical protein
VLSSPVYLPCGAEQENPPHGEDHEDSDKEGHGEGNEDYFHDGFPFLSCRLIFLILALALLRRRSKWIRVSVGVLLYPLIVNSSLRWH